MEVFALHNAGLYYYPPKYFALLHKFPWLAQVSSKNILCHCISLFLLQKFLQILASCRKTCSLVKCLNDACLIFSLFSVSYYVLLLHKSMDFSFFSLARVRYIHFHQRKCFGIYGIETLKKHFACYIAPRYKTFWHIRKTYTTFFFHSKISRNLSDLCLIPNATPV